MRNHTKKQRHRATRGASNLQIKKESTKRNHTTDKVTLRSPCLQLQQSQTLTIYRQVEKKLNSNAGNRTPVCSALCSYERNESEP